MCDTRDFLHLSVKQPRMHLLDEPTGCVPVTRKANLGHQMFYSAERLETELANGDEPACSN